MGGRRDLAVINLSRLPSCRRAILGRMSAGRRVDALSDATTALNVPAVQAALRTDGLDGWLLYDFRGLNSIAADLTAVNHQRGHLATRRWYYLISQRRADRGAARRPHLSSRAVHHSVRRGTRPAVLPLRSGRVVCRFGGVLSNGAQTEGRTGLRRSRDARIRRGQVRQGDDGVSAWRDNQGLSV